MKFIQFSTIVAMVIFLSLPVAATANDRSMGISRHVVPSVDGQRAIEARFNVPSGIVLDQRPLNQGPRSNRSRITLHYSIGNENFSVQRRIVPVVRGSGRTRSLTAVLPQGPGIAYPRNVPVVHLNRAYLQNPTKVNIGSQVSYRWVLETPQGVRQGSVRRFVMPHPLTVAIMGDSYASGEGAPNSSSNLLNGSVDIDTVTWDHRESHRSKHSGLLLGVKAFQNRFPQLWVEAIHVAVSGATVGDGDHLSGGMMNPFFGNREAIAIAPHHRPNTQVPAQTDRITTWLAENGFLRMHCIVLTGGGNDAGFGSLIASSILGDLALSFGSKRVEFQDKLSTFELAAKEDFVAALSETISPRQLLWVNYPDMTSDQNREISGIDLEGSLNPALMLLNQAVGGDDLQKARILLREDLNPRITDVCGDIDSDPNGMACDVVSVQDEFQGHGINADRDNRWFNTFIDSQDQVQGSLDGSVHPNREGYKAYRAPVLASLERLYHPSRGTETVKLRREAKQRVRENAKARAKRKALEQARQRTLAIRANQLKAIVANPPRPSVPRQRLAQANRQLPSVRVPGNAEVQRAIKLLQSSKGGKAAQDYARYINQLRAEQTAKTKTTSKATTKRRPVAQRFKKKT